MATKRYRCYGCNSPFGLEFVSDGPKCPSCGFEGPPAVVPLVSVHWLRPLGPSGKGAKAQIAVDCLPNRTHLTGLSATGVLAAVTCPKCRSSDAYKLACLAEEEEQGVHPDETYAGKSAIWQP